jgi:hypothetical protein
VTVSISVVSPTEERAFKKTNYVKGLVAMSISVLFLKLNPVYHDQTGGKPCEKNN